MNLDKVKRYIRQLQTFCYHPYLTCHILRQGVKTVCIGKRLQMNSFNHIRWGNNVRLGNDCRLTFIKEHCGVVYNPALTIGNGVFLGNRCSILCADKIDIGEGTLIASDVLITSENHGIDLSTGVNYSEQPLDAKPVSLGKNCWIGEKVSILPGVELGDNVIVGAHAVVTKSFPANTMLMGIPARVIKKYDFNIKEWVKV